MSITAAQLATDLAAIAAGFPAAVVAVTFNGHAYSCLRGSGTQAGAQEDMGAIRSDSFQLLFMQAALTVNGDEFTPLSSEMTIGGETYLCVSAQPDPTSTFQIVTVDKASHFVPR